MNFQNDHTSAWYKRSDLLLVFIAYLFCLAFSLLRHEPWGDELHSWNIAKASSGFGELIANTRFEGHPPLWYILLFMVSKFSHNPLSMQFLQFIVCMSVAFIFLFKFRLDISLKMLILFGYYFLFEYGVFSRNYALGVMLAFLCCLQLRKKNSGYSLYYVLLFLLSNTHFLALILAGSLHVYFVDQLKETGRRNQLLHLFLGMLLLSVALFFIFPPSSSGLNTGFWLKIWNKDQLFIAVQAPLKAFCPIPAWWEYHFWNTQVLLQLQKSYSSLKFVTPLLSIALIAGCMYILRSDKKALFFFCLNFALTLLFALIFPLTTQRYVGFIFIGFVIALEICKEKAAFDKAQLRLLYLLFGMQVAGALIALPKDWQYPFSRGSEIVALKSGIPPGEKIITDYWCLNYYSAFTDEPVYCLGFNKQMTHLLWDREMTRVSQMKDIYSYGAQLYLEQNNADHIYFMTNTPRQDIQLRDSVFFNMFNVTLIAEKTSAIEKYSNIYLYKIAKKNN